jgi:acetyl esterase/lipase
LQARLFAVTFTAFGSIKRRQILSIEAFKKRNARCSNDTLMFRLLAACALACAFTLHAASPSLSGPLTAEELFRAAELGEARISPDGRHLGAIVTDDKDLKNLLVYDLKDYKPTGLRASGSFEISNFHWLGDARVVFNVSRNKVYSWGLYSARLETLDRFAPIDSFDVTQVVGLPRGRPGRILVWVTQSSRDSGRPGELLELDADRVPGAFDRPGAGGTSIVRSYSPPEDGPVVGWECNRIGELALCTTWSGGQFRLHRYLPASRTWARVPLVALTRPMGVDYDDRFLWVVRILEMKNYELCRMNLETGAIDKPLLTEAEYDIGAGHLYFSGVSRRVAGVTYAKRRTVSVWFSAIYASAQDAIDRLRPGTENVLIDHDLAERKFLFQLNGPEHPASYELLDLEARTLRNVADAAPWLRNRPLRPVQSVSFVTRDGVRLEGYQALPEGASAGHPVPLVVYVHGGPWVRDVGWYDPVVQFLVSRGYSVFQPNYRGSTGYAPKISHDGEYDFMRMHNDVTDATMAILSTGIIDPKRIAVMGASFGGYLAVSGVAFEDGLYRCAVSECGVFDWERQIKSKSDVGRPGEYQIMTDELEKTGQDRKHLEEISPLRHTERIHVPVLIAHGTEDGIVDVAQSKKLASELRRRGVPCETFYRSLEGHGFYNYVNRVAFYHRVEAFLAANLGGATLTPVK